jgi:hypothetical protein
VRKVDRGPDPRHSLHRNSILPTGGPYSAFAGRDASRGLATFDAGLISDAHDDLSDLKPAELDQVRVGSTTPRAIIRDEGQILSDDLF